MNDIQQEAMDIAIAGHSLLLTGCAGTGKTFLTLKIVEELQSRGNSVIVCSATGISTIPYHSVGAQTVHSTFGLRDGRYSHKQLATLFSGEDDYYVEKRNQIMTADVVVIDEISMISVRILSSINFVAQQCRKNKLPMGGLQRIFVGDLLQLSPVSNHGDPGIMCYKYVDFSAFVPHKVGLCEIMRTNERPLSNAVNHLARGVASDETTALLKSLNRPLTTSPFKKKVLYATNFSAWKHNLEELDKMDGESVVFNAEDEGEVRDLAKLPVDKVIKFINIYIVLYIFFQKGDSFLLIISCLFSKRWQILEWLALPSSPTLCIISRLLLKLAF